MDAAHSDSLTLDLDGYEGPLHVLLALAKTQKVDLRQISITALVDQYLVFIADARALQLDVAADYLVMAAWLAYLKSKLLLPVADKPQDEASSAEDMATRLAFRLWRLSHMRTAADQLMALPQWGREVFGRMAAPGLVHHTQTAYAVAQFDLIRAYGAVRNAGVRARYAPAKPQVYALEQARQQVTARLRSHPDWQPLSAFVPRTARLPGQPPLASYAASLLSAALELTKDEQASLRQSDRDALPEVRG